MTTAPSERLGRLLADGTGRAVFAMLTDEELLNLDHDLPDDLRVTPFLDDHPSADPEFARLVGTRSLLARGLVRPSLPDAGMHVELDDELTTIMRCRREGVGLLRARAPERPYGSARTFVLHDRRGGFEEEVVEAGLHYVAACTSDVASDRLAQWCLGDHPTPARSARDRVPTADWPGWLRDNVGTDVALSCLDVALPAAPGRSVEQAVWGVARSRDLAVVAVPVDGDLLEVHQSGHEHLAALLHRQMLAAVDDPGR